jgi:hypothetical protein
MSTQINLVEAVKDHAEKNYDAGWGVIVECWTSDEIEKAIKGCRTTNGAIKKMKAIIRERNSYAEEIQAECF